MKGGAFSVLNLENVPLESKDHALETTWSRGQGVLEDSFKGLMITVDSDA